MSERSDWEIPGRAVVPEWRKRRDAKRAGRFVMVGLGELLPALATMKASKALRLFLAMCLQQKLRKTRDGWIDIPRHDLISFDLDDRNYYRVVAQLEMLGLIEVCRRSGKRPLLRFIKRGGSVIKSTNGESND
jgi:hypothetical protein